MTKLSAFLDDRKISQSAFAARVGVHQSIVSRLCTGATRPGLDLALAIEAETGGEVPVSSWVSASKLLARDSPQDAA